MKFINDDEHIKNDFGYNRLNERYKQCARCRTSSREQKAEYRADMKNNMRHMEIMTLIEIINQKIIINHVKKKLLMKSLIVNCVINQYQLIQKINMLIHHYVKEEEIYLDIWNSLVHTTLWTKNILLMVILILMVLLN